MRAIAAEAGVSVPTVELAFGTKARLLKAAVDVAVAGDDEAVPVLDRDWASAALAGLARQLVAQREVVAGWIVDGLAGTAPLRPGVGRADAVETVWILMDPAVFDRLVRYRAWTVQRYQDRFAASVRRLLVPDPPLPPEEHW